MVFTMASEESEGSSRGMDRASEGGREQAESRQSFSNEAVESSRENGSNAQAQNEQNKLDSQQLADDGKLGNLTLTDDQATRSLGGKSGRAEGIDNAAETAKADSTNKLGNDIAHDLAETNGQLKSDTMEKLGKEADKAYQKDGDAGLSKLSDGLNKSMRQNGVDSKLSLPNRGDLLNKGKDYHEVQFDHANGSRSAAPLNLNHSERKR